MTDDCTLLNRYAANRDEAAFAEVVRRHLPFVYSAALRRLGRDTHQAQDVAQLVFCSLAREAHRIARYPVLSGWLFTATRNAVINVVRRERRRRSRENEAFHMQQIDSEPEGSSDWSKLQPVLDSALDQLSSRDREAVLLRFFEGRSFGEIGTTTGLSEDAVRKRIDRALAKLRDRLRPHGVASTSATLATLLASQPAAAAPPALLASVTGAALSIGATSAGLAAFLTMTKLQTGIAAAIIAAGAVGLITQQRTISELRANATLAQQQLAQQQTGERVAGKFRNGAGGDAAKVGSVDSASTVAPVSQPTARGELLAETSSALSHGKVPERYFALVTVLRKLTRDNWREVLQAFQDERKRTGLGHPEVFEIFARRAGEVAGEDAVSFFLKNGWGGDANEAMIGWAAKDPVEALRWLGREADTKKRHELMGAAIRGLALTEPDLAVRTLEEQPTKDRIGYVDELVTSMLRSAGIDGVQRLVEGMIARATNTEQLKADYLKYVFTDFSLKRIAQSAASGTISDSATWLGQHVSQPYFDRRIIAEAAAPLVRENPLEAFRWLERINQTLLGAGDASTVGYRVLLDTWSAQAGPQVVETWLQTQMSHSHYDHIASNYAALVAAKDPGKAVKWANTIKEPKIKQESLQLISQRTSRGKS